MVLKGKNKQGPTLKDTDALILQGISSRINSDLQNELKTWNISKYYKTWNEPFFQAYTKITAKFLYNVPQYECPDCDYSAFNISTREKYFGQVKNGKPFGRGATLNFSDLA